VAPGEHGNLGIGHTTEVDDRGLGCRTRPAHIGRRNMRRALEERRDARDQALAVRSYRARGRSGEDEHSEPQPETHERTKPGCYGVRERRDENERQEQ
jgi:hypothetical protein